MKNLIYAVPIAILAIVISGCGAAVIQGKLNAATYQPLPTNASFTVLDSGSHTFTDRLIQDLVATEMKKRGFNPANSPDKADLAVSFSYTIGDGETHVGTTHDHLRGGKNVVSYTVFRRHLQISIIDVALSKGKSQPVFAWQAEIYSTGSSRNIGHIASRLLPELFENLGETVTNKAVRIPSDPYKGPANPRR